MNNLTNFLESLINAFTRSRGTVVFIESNDEPSELFSFTHKKSRADREWRCLGLHVESTHIYR